MPSPEEPFCQVMLEAGFLAGLLTVLIPVSWWLLIARVIHAETLVGDRQFWLTRPYEWKKLLGAKALFLAVFLYLPLLIAQCLLLFRAGFHPLSFIPGLLFNLLLITGVHCIAAARNYNRHSYFCTSDRDLACRAGLLHRIRCHLFAIYRTSVSIPSERSPLDASRLIVFAGRW